MSHMNKLLQPPKLEVPAPTMQGGYQAEGASWHQPKASIYKYTVMVEQSLSPHPERARLTSAFCIVALIFISLSFHHLSPPGTLKAALDMAQIYKCYKGFITSKLIRTIKRSHWSKRLMMSYRNMGTWIHTKEWRIAECAGACL